MKIFLLIFIILSLSNIFAFSNESMQAQDLLKQAERDILEMQNKEIPITRVNETYYDALQIYSAQISLEESKKIADYKLVLEYTDEIRKIKNDALQAKDELDVFIETFETAKQDTDFSEFEEQYNAILNSFKDERFEETLILINKGYEKITEIQSNQTATKVFYSITTKTLKAFLKKQWMNILIVLFITFLVLFIFWNRIVRWKLKKRLNNLMMQKKAIDNLMKKMQKEYFKDKKTSETGYKVKLKKYEEMLREIDRQIMILREELFRHEKMKEQKI